VLVRITLWWEFVSHLRLGDLVSLEKLNSVEACAVYLSTWKFVKVIVVFCTSTV